MKNSTPEKRLIVAIDGPAASGKSTAGKMLSARLGYTYIDTGALYRAVAWLAKFKGLSESDPQALAAAIAHADLELVNSEGGLKVMALGRDISEVIRTEETGRLASTLSALPEVRQALLDVQRRLGAGGGVVMDGRDIGTVIFPDADVKFFLSADPKARGKRRWLELTGKGEEVKLDNVRRDVLVRDQQDSQRAHAPLKQAPDAIPIDSTGMSPEEVVSTMIEAIGKRI